MRTWIPVICSLIVLAASVLSWVGVSRASDSIDSAAEKLITQSRVLQRRLSHMITITYQSAAGAVTVSTSAGDQLDGEPTDMVARQAARLAAAKSEWPQV